MPAAAGSGSGSGGGSPNAAAGGARLSVSSSHSDLYWAASSWLKQVGAHHPDFLTSSQLIALRSDSRSRRHHI